MTKTIRLWYLYDFANSFASVVLIFYYPLMLSERGASEAWIGISASVATTILLFILPYLGAWSDKTGRRIYLIKISSILMVLSLFVIAFLAQNLETLSTAMLWVLSFFYVLFQVSFQGSYVFYSAMLRDITTAETNIKVSGAGMGYGQLGNVLSLLIMGPIIASSVMVIGLSGKPLALFLGGLLFAIISIPFFRQKETVSDLKEMTFSYHTFIYKVIDNKRLFYFIIGYALLSDSIMTFQLYISLYVQKIFNFSDQFVAFVGINGLVFIIIGAFLTNKFALRLKSKEVALQASALLYALCFAAFALMPTLPWLVFFVVAVSGLSYGLLFSLARTVYSEISPKDEQGEFFSIYTVFERAASIVGPLVWILTFYLLVEFGENIQYRGSVLFLVFVAFVGRYYLKKSTRQIIPAQF
jgi:UMF1 family MFS transporter